MDPSLDERVLEATRRALSEHGWTGMTIRGVASTSGVSRPAIARRWPTKAHLVLEAILGSSPDLTPFDGVDRDGWLRAVVDGSFALFSRPEAIAAVPGLLAEFGSDDEFRSALWQRFSGPASRLLDQAGDGGDSAVDAQAMIAVAAGAAMFASLVVGREQSDVPARVRQLTLELLDGHVASGER